MAAGVMASLTVAMSVLPAFPSMKVYAIDHFVPGDTMTSNDPDSWNRHFCIDSVELLGLHGGLLGGHEQYQYVIPSSRLSSNDEAILFWAMVSLYRNQGLDKHVADFAAAVEGAGLSMRPDMTVSDMKKILHSPSVRAKYSWINTAAANAETYMKAVGVLGGSGSSGSTVGGKRIPSILQEHSALEAPLSVDTSTYTISFDPGGADSDFIRTVPLKFSTDNGAVWSDTPLGGWSVQKTDTSIVFSNASPQPVLVQFCTEGTAYAVGGGSYSSVQDMYDSCLQLWVCYECHGVHTVTPSISPLEWHQRFARMEMNQIPLNYYAALGSQGNGSNGGTTPVQGFVNFKAYRHEEDYTSNYNIQLNKYDYETGKPLEDAAFAVYERFDDKEEVNRQQDGAIQLYEGGEPYKSTYKDDPVLWNDFRRIGAVTTDTGGYASFTQNHTYHYDKTFCDGHPAPGFVSVPEEEEDEETGEIENEAEIEAAQEENRRLANTWLECFAACEAKSAEFSGVHFHWLQDAVRKGEIENIAGSGGSPGETPDAGPTASASGTESYDKSGCKADCEATYAKFIALKYSYALVEIQAREGYILHDIHGDDIPIEVIITDSSENGANASFGGLYGKDITVNDQSGKSAASYTMQYPAELPEQLENEKSEEPAFLKRISDYIQTVRTLFVKDDTNRTAEDEFFDEEIDLIDDISTPSDSSADDHSDTAAFEDTNTVETTKPNTEPDSVEKATVSNAGPDSEKKATISNTGLDNKEKATISNAGPDSKGKAAIFDTSDRIVEAGTGKLTEADGSAAEEAEIATASNLRMQVSFCGQGRTMQKAAMHISLMSMERTAGSFGGSSALFTDAYTAALAAASEGDDVVPGTKDNYSHCNEEDGEGNRWRIYDHRTEGEIHFNKRDMELQAGEGELYDSYGDSQGDGTLEGAVYGLFAAEDIVHPDGKTGVVYKKNNLAAVAATDKNGDASFMAYTEAPGRYYDYTKGMIENTADGWAAAAPKNLYAAAGACHDYTADGVYITKTGVHERTYPDYEKENGNCWIGRPLILGDYYIKELTRSEGYELSIGEKGNLLTNRAQDPEVAVQEASGYASVTSGLWAEMQEPVNPTGEYGSPYPNELFFSVASEQTGNQGFDLLLKNLPAGTRLYRLDTSTVPASYEAGTGEYELKYLTDSSGSPVYVTAEHDYQYPKYNADGSFMITERTINVQKDHIPYRELMMLSDEATETALKKTSGITGDMTAEEIIAELSSEFEISKIRFMKAKLEEALRANGYRTPYIADGSDRRYSAIADSVYDTGDSTADPVIYGNPVQTLLIRKALDDGSAVGVGDLIYSVLDYYDTHPYYDFGGIDGIREEENNWIVSIYTGRNASQNGFFVDSPNDGYVFFMPVPYIPEQTDKVPRTIYAVYSEDGRELSDGTAVFGTYRNFNIFGNSASALLVTDAAADRDGNLESRTIYENVYYKTGEIPRDADGGRIQKTEYVEKTETRFMDREVNEWVEITGVGAGAPMAVHIDSSYTDKYGKSHNDDTRQNYDFRLVLPGERYITIGDTDLDTMGNNRIGWKAGDQVGSGIYSLLVNKASVKVYLDYKNQVLAGDSSYVVSQSLTYPGQDYTYQDGDGTPGTKTRKEPIGVQERSIKQQIKVTKDIEKTSYNNTNSYSQVHEDWWTKLFGGFFGGGRPENAASKLGNFRFKSYLKSNLERIYRDGDGTIIWQDRKGRELDGNDAGVLEDNRAFPALVRKIYTRVLHKTDPLYQDSKDAVIANTTLYSYTDGRINENQNSGYTAVLEMVERLAEDDTGTRMVKAYNYDKFFDAIAVANHDKWDDAAPTYTSWRPIGNAVNRTEDTILNAQVSDAVRQFAIDWYLDDEVKKLVRPAANPAETEADDGKMGYSDELYDEALRAAVIKAENYLKPFFAYDLDEIYAIQWDGETNGGRDRDTSTLSADMLYEPGAGTGGTDTENSYYYGTSVYLPYGTYVVVEQQPGYAYLNDFANKHYQTDRPKEVVLPAVYADYAGSQSSPERTNDYYNYDSAVTQSEMERKYNIRFNEESHIIQAHNHCGDFEIFKYGLDMDWISNGAVFSGAGGFFALTQAEYKPYKNYYNEQDDRTTGHVPYYLTEGQSGRDGISLNYRYSSVSENAGKANDVPYMDGSASDDNVPGIRYKDHVSTMHGVQTAFDGKYASMLVPWTVTAPDHTAGAGTEKEASQTSADGESSYHGYSYTKFRNRFYTARLRLEKLDGETHENILHDGALFAIYAAKRDDSQNGDGRVLFYEKPTVITGTELFLKAMGAADIRPMARRLSFWDRLTGKGYGPGNLYTGIVPAGTPICEESEKVVLGDSFGNQTVAFKSYSTVLDGYMKNETTNAHRTWQYQTVGYLKTPQPLGAGTYVIVEEKAPAGYARSKPVAIELYSVKTAYYKEGNKDSRELAACYEYDADYQTTYGNKPQDSISLVRIHVENEPIRLRVEKLKESSAERANTTKDKTVTYKVSGRIDGTLTEIGGRSDYIYAYENGNYLGYAWKKGTLEYLAARKAAGEQVRLAFEGAVFAGYGYVTRMLETADDENSYAAGAVMTLFDALELIPSGDSQDKQYEGLVIERNLTNNITRMYVKEGYAGEKTDFVTEKDENGKEYMIEYQAGTDADGQPVMETGHIWLAVTLNRHDTDILYYDLDNLDVLTTETINGEKIIYGYGRNHEKIALDQVETEKKNFDRTDTPHAIYAFRGGTPYLEFVGGDFRKIQYSAWNKVLTVDPKTQIYHLDRDGNRDALVDPYTGMAYVTEIENGREKILVWPVWLRRDGHGNVISRDKITTSRVATIGECEDGYKEHEILEVENHSGKEIPKGERPSYTHTESGYLTGSWNGKNSGESHREVTVRTTKEGRNLNGEVLTDQNNGEFKKNLSPVVDEHGLAVYYQRSKETYDKGTELYDRNDDFVRYQDSDNLENYNNNAYRIQEHGQLFDGEMRKEQQEQSPLYHRMGEGYILENTWTSSDKTPNDPFHDQRTDGQPDILKRVPAGTYIMEELSCPNGYVKGMPTGITVHETEKLQQTSMVNQTTKVEISKLDGTQDAASELGSYGFGQVSGAVLALYEAKRVYTNDRNQYPKGYYLKKTGLLPFRYLSTEHTAGKSQELTARWLTNNSPIYAEGIPTGDYILEELRTPAGFVTGAPVEIEIENTAQVQSFLMYNDHTKVEFEKYYQEGGKEYPLAGAEFVLYPAIMDEDGNAVYKEEKPEFYADQELDRWKTCDRTVFQEFLPAFEAMYREYGAKPGLRLSWTVNGRDYHAVCENVEKLDAALDGGTETAFPDRAVMVMRTGEGASIRVLIYGQYANRGGREFNFEYQFNYKKLPQISEYAASYDTLEGKHRIDYLPAESSYVLRETRTPYGFVRAEDVLVKVSDTPQIHRFRVENREGMLLVSKTLNHTDGELKGAHLALYRADDEGALVQQKEYLVDDWITGEDGTYTEADEINRKIPAGFQKGDLKPHAVRRLNDGIYWLVELSSPDYLNTFEPVRVDYRQGDEIRVVRTEDTMALGELTIHKTDELGSPLTGAVYELAAFRQSDLRTPLFTRRLSGAEASIHLSGLQVGEIGSEGRIVPYRYRLREITPPDGYAVNTEIVTWQFEPNRQGSSYVFGEAAKKEISVINKKTQVLIGKRDFDVFGDKETSGAFVAGAELAVYEVRGRDEKDRLIYDESAPCDLWVTEESQAAKGHIVEGLVAGYSYLLRERKAPEGYHIMQPILFTLSLDGRRIVHVSNQLNTITVHTITPADAALDTDNPDIDSIQAVTVRGRYAVGVEYILSDQDGEELTRWRAVTEEHVLVRDQRLIEGKAYTLTEITRYSDGSAAVTGKTTKTLCFDENGQCRLPVRMAEAVTIAVQHEDGEVIDSFSVNEWVQERSIRNNAAPEHPKIAMKNKNGRCGDALNAGQAVLNTVSFVNLSYRTEDMEVVISPGEGTKIIDGGTGVMQNGRLVFQISDVKSFGAGSVSFVTSVEEGQLSSTLTAAVHSNGTACVTTKTVPVMQKNQLTVFHELTGSGKRLFGDEESHFTIRLFHGKTGEELKGAYRYQGSRTGYMHSGDTLALAGNEFITIDPGLYHNIRYEVVREADGKIFDAWGESTHDKDIEPGAIHLENSDEVRIAGTASSEIGGFAVFTRMLPDTVERERFQKGESYILTETTAYTDGTSLESSRMQITLGDKASVESIAAMDQKTKVKLSKVEISGGEELPGCEMELQDQQGNVIDTWISGEEPYELEGVLIPGKKYRLIEKNPASGYSYGETITFTVNEDGTVEQVVMVDRPTHVTVAKTDSMTGRMIGGALLQVIDEQGHLWESWISGSECHEIRAKLCAGQLYYLHEERAPAGYQKRSDLAFLVPVSGDVLEINFSNDRIQYSDGSSDEPHTPEPEILKKVGRITVHYKTGLFAAGEQIRTASSYERTMKRSGIRRLSKTGDDSRNGWYVCLMAAALAGIFGCLTWIRKGKRSGNQRRHK